MAQAAGQQPEIAEAAPTPAPQNARSVSGKRVYKIQLVTAEKKLSANSRLLKGYKNVDFYIEKGIYKYTYGETTSFESIKKLRRQVAKDFKDAFIIAFKDGEKVDY